MLPEMNTKRALLLQGPVGPFFRRFGAELRDHGVEVTKVNFNAGDGLFYRGSDVVRFNRPMEEWPQFFRSLVAERDIDTIFLFGDCRPMHKQAVRICKQLGIEVYVFEEGYLRPDHITMERGGVNGFSSMPKDPEVYRRETENLPELPKPIRLGNTFPRWALWTTLHSWAVTFCFWRYPHYKHHRTVNSFWQGFCWIRGAIRKLWYSAKERGVLEELSGPRSGSYFFVPLQVHCDAQLQHSEFETMEEFIDEVISTFAEHAPADCGLVLKHHPHDRPYRDYTTYIRHLGERYGCGDRLTYVHDLHLPTLLQHARGTVTMNSTVGTSSMYHGTPVKVLGRAVYDVPGLTSTNSLAEFFNEPGEVDSELFDAFCTWMRVTNQVNGSFYKRVPGIRGGAGLAVLSAEAMRAPDDVEPRDEPAAAS